jgi:hypothetical protein
MIRTLEGWGVLLPSVATEFRALMEARHRAIHFNPATAARDREFAIEALKHLDEIIAVQFGAFRNQPWFIPEARGVAYIRKDWENDPFVKLVYLPASMAVGPHCWMECDKQTRVWTIYDLNDFEEGKEVSDAEFLTLTEAFTEHRLAEKIESA